VIGTWSHHFADIHQEEKPLAAIGIQKKILDVAKVLRRAARCNRFRDCRVMTSINN
jgi:hypothetical protein